MNVTSGSKRSVSEVRQHAESLGGATARTLAPYIAGEKSLYLEHVAPDALAAVRSLRDSIGTAGEGEAREVVRAYLWLMADTAGLARMARMPVAEFIPTVEPELRDLSRSVPMSTPAVPAGS